MKKALISCALGLAAIAYGAAASAQCTVDTDCKGNRICQAGACVDAAPAPVVATAPAPAAVSTDSSIPQAGGYTPFRVGVYMAMGMSHSIIKHDDYDTDEIMYGYYGIREKPKPRFAGGGGAYFDFYVMELLAIEAGIGFVGKGFWLKEDDLRVWERLIYMEIPVGVKLNIKEFQIGLAVAMYVALSGKTKAKDDDNESTSDWNDERWDDYKRFNLAPKLTLGYGIPLGPVFLVPGLSFSFELLNNAKGDADDNDIRERNWNLMITVGAEFGFGN